MLFQLSYKVACGDARPFGLLTISAYNAIMKPSTLRQRRHVVEKMDAPDLDERMHREALAGLERLNRAANATPGMVGPILRVAQDCGLKRMTVLDVACGGGDVPLRLAELGRRAGVTLELTLCDRSGTALALAREKLRQANIDGRCVPGEAPFGLPAGQPLFDVVISSLFMHHLEAREAIDTLEAMKVRTGRLLVISDLRRSFAGYQLAWWGSRILSRSPIVHFDGPASVEAAWAVSEMRELAREAGLYKADVRNCWPWRLLLTWRREFPA
jgi:2-polyprenyl-3-methyl-5-hydroxy-6-metoxy-1,4-benzoquinol methylase